LRARLRARLFRLSPARASLGPANGRARARARKRTYEATVVKRADSPYPHAGR
jgi:hypothetical protein